MTREANLAAEAFLREHLLRKVRRTQPDMSPDVVAEHARTVPHLGVPMGTPLDVPAGHRTLYYQPQCRTSEVVVELNAATGHSTSWIMPAEGENSTRAMDEAAALLLATRTVNPPQNAQLAESGYEEVGGQPIYSARWLHYEQGIRVERDYLRVLINGRTARVFAVYAMWHAVSEEPTVR